MAKQLKYESAADVIGELDSLAVEYFKLRKNQIKSMARLRATTIVHTLLYPIIEENTSGIDGIYMKEQLSVDWLSGVMVSVQPDSDKIKEALSFVKVSCKERIGKEILEKLVVQLNTYLKEDFNGMRSLKQSIYYRSRSINAIISFFKSREIAFRSTKFINEDSGKDFLVLLKKLYIEEGAPPRHTKNSYLNEFFSFVFDVKPILVPSEEMISIKSLDSKFTQNLSSFTDLASKSPVIESAYDDLINLIPSRSDQDLRYMETKLSKHGNLETNSSSISISIRKGEGIFLTHTSPINSIKEITVHSDALLRRLIEEAEIPDVEIQIQTLPVPALVMRCAEKTTPAQLLELRRIFGEILS
jgi:hypothetical protein